LNNDPQAQPSQIDGRRLAIVTGTGIEHAYVAQRLIGAFPGCLVVIDEAPPKGKWKRWRRLPLRIALSRLSRSLLLAVLRDRSRKRLTLIKLLGDHRETLKSYPGLHLVAGINSRECIELLNTHRADLLLVYGTGIVASRTLATPSVIALNMHTGVSPRYRGTDCAFWPLANGEPHFLGATVHECTAAIDGGQIFGIALATIERGDGIHDAFAHAVKAGADLYIEIVARFLSGQTPQGTTQDLAQGKEYRSWMRGIWVEVCTRWYRRDQWAAR
jgi:hypothetical protein